MESVKINHTLLLRRVFLFPYLLLDQHEFMALNTETRRSDFRPRRSVGVGDAAGGCNLEDKQTAPPALHQSERKPASPPPTPEPASS